MIPSSAFAPSGWEKPTLFIREHRRGGPPAQDLAWLTPSALPRSLHECAPCLASGSSLLEAALEA